MRGPIHNRRMRIRSLHLVTVLVLTLATGSVPLTAQRTSTHPKIAESDLRAWLGYLASDELEGRQVHTEGLGLAAAYLADHLQRWGVRPGGEGGTYFQTVKVLGVKTRSRSRVTVTAKGQSRTFEDGQGVTFSKNQGGKQTITARAVFVGYGLTIPELHHDDFGGRDVTGRIVLYTGPGPQGVTSEHGRLVRGRGRAAIETHHAAAAIGSATAPMFPGAPAPAAAAPGAPARADFQTVQRLDTPVAPSVTASDEFFAFVFGAAGADYADLKAKAERHEALPAIDLGEVTLAVAVDADYDIVQTRLTRNVVGIVEGSDQRLKDTYVLVGSHYDHVGYQQTAQRGGAVPFSTCPGQTRPTPRADDIVFNGADDDGSGTVATMAIAQAYAKGPKPKRSVMFVWHAGEEAGLLGSRYMADYPTVPIDKMAAQLNIDMVGRNRCDDPAEGNTVYLVGSDRISTELHNLSEAANAAARQPMTLDYEMNDPADPESLYTRSDHYSYAAKGIPIIFYTTGLHRDYHYVTDEVDKIEFGKVERIAHLIYDTSWRLANLDHFPARDNLGPRKGKGQRGPIGS